MASEFLKEYVANSRHISTRKQYMEFDIPGLTMQKDTGVEFYLVKLINDVVLNRRRDACAGDTDI